MENLFVVRDRIDIRISYYLLCLFLIALPFDRFYSQLLFFCFIVHTLIHIDRKKLQSAFSWDRLIVSSVWFIGVIGLIYSKDRAKGLEDLGRQSAILLFPFLLPASGLPLLKYRQKLLLIFGLTCVAVIFYLFVDAFYTILHYHAPLTTLFSLPFINHNFSAPIGIHATYLSMYVALSLVFFMHCFFIEKNTRDRILYSLAMFILVAGLMQLASRSVLLATVFIFIIVFPLFLPKGSLRLRFVAAVIMVSLFAIAGILSIDSFKKRYFTGLKDELTQVSLKAEKLEPRADRWKFILDLIKQKPIVGYGSGSERRILKETWYENKYYNSYLHELNAHNQYLSILFKYGAWGLLVFLFTLSWGLAASWKQKDVLFAAFMTIICIVSFSENILDVNKGIFFYAFFFSFFTWQNSSTTKNQLE